VHASRVRAGLGYDDLVSDLRDSPEGRARRGEPAGDLRRPGNPDLVDLTALRPDRYALGYDVVGREVLTFEVTSGDDFDWLEAQIVGNGYYEHDGVWSLDIDDDKRVMADIMAAFRPGRVLEIGCASGAVLTCLAELGIDVTGVDVSAAARAAASDLVRDRIVVADLLDADLPAPFDLVLGLDVFEHLNPNRIGAYLSKVADLVSDGGWVVANIPAFGDDPSFGAVHGDYLDDGNPLHRRLHVDDRGYPLHGHIVWATWQWWQEQFEAAGLHRCTEVESFVQAGYREYLLANTPARASMFVFAKGTPDLTSVDGPRLARGRRNTGR
jgi:SAM-dependent methyltransferase